MRTSFSKSEMTGSAYDFDRVVGQWKARVEGWVRSSGKFWLPAWGPRPNERGCLRAGRAAADGPLTATASAATPGKSPVGTRSFPRQPELCFDLDRVFSWDRPPARHLTRRQPEQLCQRRGPTCSIKHLL